MNTPRHTVEIGPVTFVVAEVRGWTYDTPAVSGDRTFTPRTSVFVNGLNYPFNVTGDHRAELRAAVEAYYESGRPV